MGFKSYKNETFTERVFIIKKTTKKAVPTKYYVNGKWYLQSSLLKSAPRDVKSQELVDSRSQSKQKQDRKERDEHLEDRLDELRAKPKKKKEAEEPIEEKMGEKSLDGMKRREKRKEVWNFLKNAVRNEHTNKNDRTKKENTKNIKNKEIRNLPT